MPKPIAIGQFSERNAESVLRAQLARLKPGQAVLVSELAQETGFHVSSLRAAAKRLLPDHYAVRSLNGARYPTPILYKPCPGPSDSPRPKRKR